MTGTGGLRFDPSDERLVRAVWSRIAEPTDAVAQRLVAERGAVAALRLVLAGGGEPRWQVRLPGIDPQADLQLADRYGARLIVPGDDEWPSRIDALGENQPFCLWARGPLDLQDVSARCVAIVGARAATGYGLGVATRFAQECAERGVAVVSGAAFGIDAAAHQGALSQGGRTLAVLACGVERAYPRGHERLLDRIATDGCLISEVPLGTMPARWRFLERNRLIAALAHVVVVVEAGHRSGALGTAGRAAGLGVVVAAVPGPITSPASYGAHRLLREGAVCVTSAEEVVELLEPIGSAPAAEPPIPRAAYDGLSASDLRVFDALPLRQGAAVTSVGRVAGLEQAAVQAALGRLELSGLAERDGPGWRKAAKVKR